MKGDCKLIVLLRPEDAYDKLNASYIGRYNCNGGITVEETEDYHSIYLPMILNSIKGFQRGWCFNYEFPTLTKVRI
jgi:hypothetical protein